MVTPRTIATWLCGQSGEYPTARVNSFPKAMPPIWKENTLACAHVKREKRFSSKKLERRGFPWRLRDPELEFSEGRWPLSHPRMRLYAQGVIAGGQVLQRQQRLVNER